MNILVDDQTRLDSGAGIQIKNCIISLFSWEAGSSGSALPGDIIMRRVSCYVNSCTWIICVDYPCPATLHATGHGPHWTVLWFSLANIIIFAFVLHKMSVINLYVRGVVLSHPIILSSLHRPPRRQWQSDIAYQCIHISFNLLSFRGLPIYHSFMWTCNYSFWKNITSLFSAFVCNLF